MFKLIYNISSSFFFGVYSLILTIVTGKKVKISHYHFEEHLDGNNLINLCSDKFIKTQYASNVSIQAKRVILQDFISHLEKDNDITSITDDIPFPIFNGKEVIGSRGLSPVLHESLQNYLDKQIR
jgi:hypothetical protein